MRFIACALIAAAQASAQGQHSAHHDQQEHATLVQSQQPDMESQVHDQWSRWRSETYDLGLHSYIEWYFDDQLLWIHNDYAKPDPSEGGWTLYYEYEDTGYRHEYYCNADWDCNYAEPIRTDPDNGHLYTTGFQSCYNYDFNEMCWTPMKYDGSAAYYVYDYYPRDPAEVD